MKPKIAVKQKKIVVRKPEYWRVRIQETTIDLVKAKRDKTKSKKILKKLETKESKMKAIIKKAKLSLTNIVKKQKANFAKWKKADEEFHKISSE